MAVARNMKELEGLIRGAITESLKDEVSTEVVKAMTEDGGAVDWAYSKYVPLSYERTGELKNPNNVESKMIDANTLAVRNVRRDGNRNVAVVVEYGQGYYNTALDRAIGPRPFHRETENILLGSGRHIDAMKEGLEKRLGKGSVI